MGDEGLGMEKKQIEVYKAKEGEIVFDVDVDKETIWATREQISRLFQVDKTVISRHVRNIFKDGELKESEVSAKNALTAADGKKYLTNFYNLDMIISIGYRVNSRKATDFRIWATKVLHNFVVNGVAVNEKRIKELDEKKLKQLEGTLNVVKRMMERNVLTAGEANGALEVIAKYAKSFETLREFDAGKIVFKKSVRPRKELTLTMIKNAIEDLKESVQESEVFGRPRGGDIDESLAGIYKKFLDEEKYETVAEKAANLLYLIIKDRPFYDGNKRIGALLFILYLTINEFHLTENGETKISDKALTALALLIAESEENEKDLIVGLTCRMLQG